MKAVVIIEDGERFAAALQRVLIFLGYHTLVKYATDGELQNYLQSAVEGDQVVIVQTEFPEGAEFLERLRCDWLLSAPAVIFSVERQEKVQAEYPIVGKKVPGTYFIKIPFYLMELKEALSGVKPVSAEQLREISVSYCRVGHSLGSILHDVINKAKKGKVDRESLQILKRRIEILPGRPDAEVKQIDKALKDQVSKEALCEILFAIQEKIRGKSSSRREELFKRFAHMPAPKGFGTILIVDDDGYDETAIEKFWGKGYTVELIRSAKEALYKLAYDPPDILLCDWRLEGKPELGRKVALKGLNTQDVKLVILISADDIGDPPEGCEICVGRDKFDVEFINGLIWQGSEKYANA